jgi:hypothetical protein
MERGQEGSEAIPTPRDLFFSNLLVTLCSAQFRCCASQINGGLNFPELCIHEGSSLHSPMSKPTRRKFSAATFACTFPRCKKLCRNSWGLSQHMAAAHPQLPRASPIPEDPPENHMPDGDFGEFGSDADSPPPSRERTPPPQRSVPAASRGVKTEYHPVLDGIFLLYLIYCN